MVSGSWCRQLAAAANAPVQRQADLVSIESTRSSALLLRCVPGGALTDRLAPHERAAGRCCGTWAWTPSSGSWPGYSTRRACAAARPGATGSAAARGIPQRQVGASGARSLWRLASVACAAGKGATRASDLRSAVEVLLIARQLPTPALRPRRGGHHPGRRCCGQLRQPPRPRVAHLPAAAGDAGARVRRHGGWLAGRQRRLLF